MASGGTDAAESSSDRIAATVETLPWWLRDLLATLAVATLVALCSGLVPNQPEVYVIGGRYYGYPLFWRIVMTEAGTRSVAWINLGIDVVVFWVGGLVALPVARRVRDRIRKRDA